MCVNFFFIKDFSGTTAPMILKFGTNIGYDLYCVRQNQHPHAYHSLYLSIFSSPEHFVLMLSYCGQSMSVVRRAASTIALKAYSSHTPGQIDLILGRKHRGDL